MIEFGKQKDSGKNKKKKQKRPAEDSDFIMEPKKSRLWILLVIAAVLAVAGALALYIIRDNRSVKVVSATVGSEQLPAEFDGYKILLISDIKGVSFGNGNKKLLGLVEKTDFDAAVFAGDLLNAAGDADSLEPTKLLVESIIGSGRPVFFIAGENDVEIPDDPADGWNRCINLSEDDLIYTELTALGAEYIYPVSVIEKGGSRIFLTGIAYYEKLLDSYGFDSDKDFSICVTHAPIDYDVDKRLKSVNRYSFREIDYDLVLSGHTLGGQYRLPLLGALFIEGYGLFPQENVSRGLSRSQGRYSFITSGLGTDKGFRLFNTPEIAVITLKHVEAPVNTAAPES